MPKPRKKTEQPDGTLPPLKRVEPQNGTKPSDPPKPKPKRTNYASDTAEFSVPPAEEAYPDAYDAPSRKRSRKAQPDYTAAPRTPAKRRKKRKKQGVFHGLMRKLIALVVLVFGIYSLAVLAFISRLEKAAPGTRTYTAGTLSKSYVRTILLIGTDSRDLTVERGRSDSMILLTLNSQTQEIGMNSFMRDAYVEIPGHGKNKLNAAYSLGGAELLMDTLERNYDVSVDDYLCISFVGFAEVIDAFGGVEIELSDAEAQAVNVILQSEVNALMGDDPMADFLPGGGTFVLDGKQALSYSRIRYVGNADFERTSRQREVMAQLISNAKSHAVSAAPELMQNALPHISTNMSTAELYLLSLRAPFLLGYGMQQQQIPADGTWSAATIDGQSVLQVDFSANTKLLRETAFAASMTTEEGQ